MYLPFAFYVFDFYSFLLFFGSLFFSSFFMVRLLHFHCTLVKWSSPETTPVVGGRLGLISFLVVQTPFTVWRRFRASSTTDIKTRQTFFVMHFIYSGQKSTFMAETPSAICRWLRAISGYLPVTVQTWIYIFLLCL